MSEELERELKRWYDADRPQADERRRAIERVVDAWEQRPRGDGTDVVALYPGDETERQARAATRRAARRMTYWGAAAAAAIVVALAWGARDRTPGMAGESGGDSRIAAVGPRLVAFSINVPDQRVRNVALAGDFNGWSSSVTPMTRDPAAGVWRAQVLLPPGRHVYSFVLDGTRWVIDPLAPHAGDDELGPANAIVIPGESE